jgi:hypothetical protein
LLNEPHLIRDFVRMEIAFEMEQPSSTELAGKWTSDLARHTNRPSRALPHEYRLNAQTIFQLQQILHRISILTLQIRDSYPSKRIQPVETITQFSRNIGHHREIIGVLLPYPFENLFSTVFFQPQLGQLMFSLKQ